MSEIEKMYENANAYKNLCKCSFKNLFDYSINYGQDVCIHVEDEIRHGCEGCELAEQNIKYYPPFTPDKQLELIKWLMVNNKDYQYNVEDNKYWFIIDDYRETKYREFDEALAELINLYWQFLAEQERTEITDILRG